MLCGHGSSIIRGVAEASPFEGDPPCPHSNLTSIGTHLGTVARLAAPKKSGSSARLSNRPRIPDYLVFNKLIEVLLFGCAYSGGWPRRGARPLRCLGGATSGSRLA